jgi:hypothetical protein
MADEDIPPWEQPGAVRRDCLPHRGPLLKGLANVTLVCGVLSWCLFVPAVPGLLSGLTAVILADGDLAKMERQEIDPQGKPETEWARRRAVWGIGLIGLWICVWVWSVLLFVVLALFGVFK